MAHVDLFLADNMIEVKGYGILVVTTILAPIRHFIGIDPIPDLVISSSGLCVNFRSIFGKWTTLSHYAAEPALWD